MDLGPYYFLGNEPGKPLNSIVDAKIAKHSKGNSEGIKTERPNIREINKGVFKKYDNIDSLYLALFGK